MDPRTFIICSKTTKINIHEFKSIYSNSILNICRFFLFQKIILQLIQVHKETDLMETMEVKYFLKLF